MLEVVAIIYLCIGGLITLHRPKEGGDHTVFSVVLTTLFWLPMLVVTAVMSARKTD